MTLTCKTIPPRRGLQAAFTPRRGLQAAFTLVELLVVIAMIAMVSAALSVSVAGAQQRARIAKATSEVKTVTQAVLAAETFDEDLIQKFESPQELSGENLRFLIGQSGTDKAGQAIPAILLASLSSGKALVDPWGTVYKISVRKGQVDFQGGVGNLKTGFTIPNLHRLSKEERQ